MNGSAFDVFISYSRRDNEQGRVTQLVERIQSDFAVIAGRELRPFFDVHEIHGMDDWQHRILHALRGSRLLRCCVSPAYLSSDYCAWESNEYQRHEVSRSYLGEGVAPLYLADVPGWETKEFDATCEAWVTALRRRQSVDLRSWAAHEEGENTGAATKERLRALIEQFVERIRRGERAEASLGNVDAHNPQFVGRASELRRVREVVGLGRVGVLTAVHGLGGMGKSALAVEYAHSFAHEYGGGRWQVRCEGKDDLRRAIGELASPLAIQFSDDERRDLDRAFARVVAELRRLASAGDPPRCLLILDNVDQPGLLEPSQTQRLPATEWLHILATSRMGKSELFGALRDRAFLDVDELPEEDALAVLEAHQPGARFRSPNERDAARGIVRLLDGYTLAVETAALYLGQFAADVSCVGFLERLKHDGLEGLEDAADEEQTAVRHGEKRLGATLQPTLDRLSEPELRTLEYAAILPADCVSWEWLETLVGDDFPEVADAVPVGQADPWARIRERLQSLRLLTPTGEEGIAPARAVGRRAGAPQPPRAAARDDHRACPATVPPGQRELDRSRPARRDPTPDGLGHAPGARGPRPRRDAAIGDGESAAQTRPVRGSRAALSACAPRDRETLWALPSE